MQILLWILIVIFSFIGLIGLIGLINPDFFNFKEGKQPFTRKTGSTTLIISLILITVFGSLVSSHKADNQGHVLKTSKSTTKAIEAAKPVKPATKTAKAESVKNKNVFSVDNPVSDQYLEDFLTFMEHIHTDLVQQVKQDPSSSDIAVFLTKENAEGWQQYEKVNYPGDFSKESQAKFEKRNDVLNAWQSLFDWDMDYEVSNVDLNTTNEKEKVFLKDFDQAKIHFHNYTN